MKTLAKLFAFIFIISLFACTDGFIESPQKEIDETLKIDICEEDRGDGKKKK